MAQVLSLNNKCQNRVVSSVLFVGGLAFESQFKVCHQITGTFLLPRFKYDALNVRRRTNYTVQLVDNKRACAGFLYSYPLT